MHTTPSSDRRGRTRLYFIAGGVSLFLMALLWSVDDSIVYILAGLAAAFFFFALYNSDRQPAQQQASQGSSAYRYRTTTASTPTLADLLKKVFARRPSYTSTPQATTRRRVVALVIGLFVFVFFLPIVITILSGNGGGDMTADDYYQLAENQYGQQQYDSALVNYRNAWKLNETHKEAIAGYANTLIARNETDSALLMLDRALAIDSSYKEASYSKAYVYFTRKDYKQAQQIMTPVVEANPDYYSGMLLLGDAFYEDQQYDPAIAQYERAYNEGGMRSDNLCYIMGFIYETKGENIKAIALYQEALSYDTTIVDLYDRLGKLMPGEQGNYYRTKASELR